MLLSNREFLYDLKTFAYLRDEISSLDYVTVKRQSNHEVMLQP